MASEIVRMVIEPFGTYSGAYESAAQARKGALGARSELDSARRRLRGVGDSASGKSDAGRDEARRALQEEVDTMEGRFREACSLAVMEMEAFVQYAEATHCIDALVKAQREYHEVALNALSNSGK
jgi:hypothetical protein